VTEPSGRASNDSLLHATDLPGGDGCDEMVALGILGAIAACGRPQTCGPAGVARRARGSCAVVRALGRAWPEGSRRKRRETHLRGRGRLAGSPAGAPSPRASPVQERSMRMGRANGLVPVDLPADVVVALGRS